MISFIARILQEYGAYLDLIGSQIQMWIMNNDTHDFPNYKFFTSLTWKSKFPSKKA